MDKKAPDPSSRHCTYLSVKNGEPVCLFRIAEPQPCGLSVSIACYYRGGPFEEGAHWRARDTPARKSE